MKSQVISAEQSSIAWALAVIGIEVLRRQSRAEFGPAPPVAGNGLGPAAVLKEPVAATSAPPLAAGGEPAPQEPLAP